MWSPSSARGTGLLQDEHFTVGRSCDILGTCWEDADDGLNNGAIIVAGSEKECWVVRPA